MKEKILAAVLFVLIILFVTVNTVIVDEQIGDIIDGVDDIDLGADNSMVEAEELYDAFMKKQGYLSITVSHNDMTSIEDCFVEMIGYISVGDVENATVVKYRLRNSLEHLRRLSEFNIDTII